MSISAPNFGRVPNAGPSLVCNRPGESLWPQWRPLDDGPPPYINLGGVDWSRSMTRSGRTVAAATG